MTAERVLLRFGPFEADCRTSELRNNGTRIRLAPQAFQVLELLARRPGELITREEMQRVLWPNQTVVDFDHSINTAIQRIRVALNDSRENPKYIETLSRRGYRFVAPVERASAGDQSEFAATVDRVGQSIGQYRILQVIGQGGMGIVYKAEDLRLGRMVALKFLSPELESSAGGRDRLVCEARTASSLNHPNIGTIYAVETLGDETFIAMEYLEGRTLRERLQDAHVPLSLNEILDIAQAIASALHAAHTLDIIHRDIKPENVFLTGRGEIKVLDFGLATALETGPSERRTRLGATPGTFGYMSPEQERGERLDVRTDLFSFGVVLREMAAGSLEIPVDLRNVIHRLVEPLRERRYQTASDALRDLAIAGQLAPPVSVRRKLHWVFPAAAAASALLLTGIVAVTLRHSRGTANTMQRGAIVIAEIVNSTGDPVFDTTLRLGLAAQLEQSPFLNIVSDRRIAETLKLMEQPAGARLTADLARQVCQRASASAAIDGSISSLGRQYVISLVATDCQSGETLTREQGTANTKEQILPLLTRQAERIRSALGESLASVHQYNAPVEDVTTPSLEALRSYSLGAKAFWGSNDSRAAVPFYERAIELDPKFAMAYLRLGAVYDEIGVGETRLSTPFFEKAYAARDRVSARERFDISSRYYEAIGDMPKALEICKLWSQTYPHDAAPLGRMANINLLTGQHERALADMLETRVRAGDSFRNYGNLIAAYLNLNRFDEARKAVEQAGVRKLEPFLYLYFLEYLDKDTARMTWIMEWAAKNPEVEASFLNVQSDTEASSGHLRRARELSMRAVALAKQHREDETAAAYLLNSALREAEFGNQDRAREDAGAALAIAPSAHGNALMALALARAGFAGRAKTIAADLSTKHPTSTPINAYFLPAIRAAVALDDADPPQAIRELETTQYDFAVPDPLSVGTLYPVYIRGEAYRKLKRTRDAVQEFQKYQAHSGTVRNFPLGALARLQLARAYAAGGDTPNARLNYQTFLSGWRTADPDIPILIEAQKEYRALTN